MNYNLSSKYSNKIINKWIFIKYFYYECNNILYWEDNITTGWSEPVSKHWWITFSFLKFLRKIVLPNKYDDSHLLVWTEKIKISNNSSLLSVCKTTETRVWRSWWARSMDRFGIFASSPPCIHLGGERWSNSDKSPCKKYCSRSPLCCSFWKLARNVIRKIRSRFYSRPRKHRL